jgi:hypothetical protein
MAFRKSVFFSLAMSVLFACSLSFPSFALAALSQTNLLDQVDAVNTVGSISVTSGSFTPPDNSLIVLHVGLVSFNGDVTGGLSVSGGGLTWTRRAGPNGANIGSYFGVHEIWTAPVTTGASMTINITNSHTNDDGVSVALVQVVSFTGYNTGTPVGGIASATNITNPEDADTITLNATPDTNSIVTASRYFNSDTEDSTATEGAGWTEVYDHITGLGYGALEMEVRGSSVSTSVSWADLVDSAYTAWGMSRLAIEIRSASAIAGRIIRLRGGVRLKGGVRFR